MLEINKKSHRHARRRQRSRSSLSSKFRWIVIISIIVAIVGAIAGAAYLLLAGKIFGAATNTTYIQRTSAESSVKKVPLAKPKVVIELFEARTTPGKAVTLTARTTPEIDCSIKVTYGKDNTLVSSAGLEPKKSDADGVVTWKWKVQSDMPVGKWPTKVLCGDPDNRGMAKKDLIVSAAQP